MLVSVTDGLVKLQVEAAGSPEHDRLMLDVKTGFGVSVTEYVAVPPATVTAWLLGVTPMPKSDILAGTDVCASTIFPGAIACTVPPLKFTGKFPVLLAVGVAVMVTVAVDPDCSEIGPQLMPVLEEFPAPHVPELMVALTFEN